MRSDPVFDAVIVGAGPSGLLAAMVVAAAGSRVAIVDPRLGSSAPQSDHVHRIDDASWDRLTRLAPALARSVVAAGAPVAPAGADSLDTALGERERVFPHRLQLDAALLRICERESGVTMRRAHVRGIRRIAGRWRLAGLQSRWLIDASGAARATLRCIAHLGRIDELHGKSGRTHVSQRFRGLPWPEPRLGHAARNCGIGLIARRVSDTDSLVTLQFAGNARLPAGRKFLDCVAVADASFCESFLGSPVPIGKPSRWTCRRASGLDADPDAAPRHWFAIGDALLTTPPHQGRGLAQVAEQVSALADALADSTGGWEVARRRVLMQARAKLIAASVADALDSMCSESAGVPFAGRA